MIMQMTLRSYPDERLAEIRDLESTQNELHFQIGELLGMEDDLTQEEREELYTLQAEVDSIEESISGLTAEHFQL